jgi:hypothetical protein
MALHLKRLVIIVLTIAAAVYAAMLLARFLFLGRFFLPTLQEYADIAQHEEPIVQAAYNFHADHDL